MGMISSWGALESIGFNCLRWSSPMLIFPGRMGGFLHLDSPICASCDPPLGIGGISMSRGGSAFPRMLADWFVSIRGGIPCGATVSAGVGWGCRFFFSKSQSNPPMATAVSMRFVLLFFSCAMTTMCVFVRYPIPSIGPISGMSTIALVSLRFLGFLPGRKEPPLSYVLWPAPLCPTGSSGRSGAMYPSFL